MFKDKNKYEVSTNQWKTPDDLVNIYADLLQAHSSIVGLIDPFHSKVRTLYSDGSIELVASNLSFFGRIQVHGRSWPQDCKRESAC